MTNVTDNATNVIPLDDTREKLEADVREWTESRVLGDGVRETVMGWLDRQDAITQRECIDRWDDKALALYADAETARKALAEECEEWERVCDKVRAERDELLRKSKEFEQTIAELHGAVCERDGRIGTYERRNTELNDALKAICNRYGVSTQWAAEDAAKKVFESIDSTHMRLPVDADGVPIRPGDVVCYFQDGQKMHVYGVCEEGFFYTYEGEKKPLPLHSNILKHVQPDTVESVLDELLEEARCVFHEDGTCEMGVTYERRAEYAERIKAAVLEDNHG